MAAQTANRIRQRDPKYRGVAMGFVTGLLSGPKALGFDPSDTLQRCGILPNQLRHSTARVSLKNYAQLYNLIAQDLDDEAFGLFSTPLRLGTFEFLTRSVLTSSDLQESLDRLSRFLRIVLPDIAVVLTKDDVHACLELRETGTNLRSYKDPRRIFAFEWLLRLIHALSCWLTDRNISLDHVDFPYTQPRHAGDYALIYTAHSTFSAPHFKARFEVSCLQARVRRTESDLPNFLNGAPGRITMLYRRDREIVRQVREVFAASLASSPTLQAIASKLHMSTRSLQRQLAKENSSLRQIKDALRRDYAFSELERTDKPISQIADELGYSDSTAFYRAFYNWTDKSPREFRTTATRK